MAAPQAVDGSLGGLAQPAFSLAKAFSIGLKSGDVGRQVEQARTGGLDHRAHPRGLVAGEIVHDDDVARAQPGDQDLLDVGFEGAAVDRAVEHERRDHAARAQAGDESRRLPVAIRDGHAQPFAQRRPASRRAIAVEAQVSSMKTSRAGIEIDLAIEPGLAAPHNVRALLLGRVRRLFFSVIRRRSKNRHNVPLPNAPPLRGQRRLISARVMSGVSSPEQGSCAAGFDPPRAPVAALPPRPHVPLQPPARASGSHWRH